MPAWQSSTWLSDTTGAERAVDGRYTDLSLDGGQCAASDGSNNSRVAGGSRRSEVHPPRVHSVCDGQRRVGYCIL